VNLARQTGHIVLMAFSTTLKMMKELFLNSLLDKE